jgi:hypothetical protein
MKTISFINLAGFILLTCFSANAQINSSSRFYKNYHPTRIFSVELSSTLRIGPQQNTTLFLNTQYALWQKPEQFLSLKTGVGVGFMRNSFGKMAAIGMPLQLVYAVGKNGHFFEITSGARFMLGFSLPEGLQVVPFAMQTIGYRYQIPKEVFFNVFAALQYHPNLGFSPMLGIAVGYDY